MNNGKPCPLLAQALFQTCEELLHFQSQSDHMSEQLSLAKDRADSLNKEWDEERQQLTSRNAMQQQEMEVGMRCNTVLLTL